MTSDSVTIASSGVDDLASLTLNLLTLTGTDSVTVTGSQLTVANLAAASGSVLTADADVLGTPVTVTVGAVSGSGARYFASSGATFVDNSAIDTGNYYGASGGVFEFRAVPVAASTFAYAGGGIFAFFNPGSTVTAELDDVSEGDALELPGTLLPSAVNFGASNLTILDSGVTYKFSNVIYSGTVNGYVSWIDSVTGLVETLFTDVNWNSQSATNEKFELGNSYLSVTGGGDTINFAGASGNAASLYSTAGDWDLVNGSNGLVALNNAQASVIGGNDTIDFFGASGNAASLYSTSGDWDLVNGSNGLVALNSAQASVVGGNDTIDFFGASGNAASLYSTAGNWDLVNGSNGLVALNNAQASAVGGNDTIGLLGGSGNAASLYSTGGHWDLINGSNGAVILNSAQASVVGGADTVDFAAGSAGNAASLYSTGGHWDTVNGSNGTVALNGAQASVVGGGDLVDFEGASGNAASLYSTAGALDTVNGSNGTVILNGAQSTVAGSSDAISFNGSSTATLNGGSDFLSFQHGIGGHDVVNSFGSTDSVYFSALDFASWSVLQGDMTQSGANTVITLNASDTISLTNVQATSLSSSQFHFV